MINENKIVFRFINIISILIITLSILKYNSIQDNKESHIESLRLAWVEHRPITCVLSDKEFVVYNTDIDVFMHYDNLSYKNTYISLDDCKLKEGN